jgi:hypothetical protein
MHIDHYSFGRIVINGQTYTSDLIIYPDKVDASWWREEGHYLQKADLADIVAARPELLIIGTGKLGIMSVPQDTVRYLESNGIEVKIERSAKAVELFNLSSKEKKVIAALHLTC